MADSPTPRDEEEKAVGEKLAGMMIDSYADLNEICERRAQSLSRRLDKLEHKERIESWFHDPHKLMLIAAGIYVFFLVLSLLRSFAYGPAVRSSEGA